VDGAIQVEQKRQLIANEQIHQEAHRGERFFRGVPGPWDEGVVR